MLELTVIITVSSIIGAIVGHCIARIFRTDSERDLDSIRTILFDLKVYQQDRDIMYSYQIKNIQLERMNMLLCGELAKHIKEPEITYLIMKTRQEAYTKSRF